MYDLCVALDVELGNSVVHNSWYFHKDDNLLTSQNALTEHEKIRKSFTDIQKTNIEKQTERLWQSLFQQKVSIED